jgi:hypothetical protein
MGNLEQVVIVLHGGIGCAREFMFQLVPQVFLGVKALVFDFPPQPTAIGGTYNNAGSLADVGDELIWDISKN